MMKSEERNTVDMEYMKHGASADAQSILWKALRDKFSMLTLDTVFLLADFSHNRRRRDNEWSNPNTPNNSTKSPLHPHLQPSKNHQTTRLTATNTSRGILQQNIGSQWSNPNTPKNSTKSQLHPHLQPSKTHQTSRLTATNTSKGILQRNIGSQWSKAVAPNNSREPLAFGSRIPQPLAPWEKYYAKAPYKRIGFAGHSSA
ncbi:hypothetical protein KM043_001240 [Ampulex compressa]|nr:hypothetical protein KM043_001240 [Ampulex compressa]